MPTTCDEPTFTQDTCTEHKKQLSIHARARDLVQNNKVSFNPQMHIFNVKGTSDITRVVTLYPSETCSCPSTGVCYHIALGSENESWNEGNSASNEEKLI